MTNNESEEPLEGLLIIDTTHVLNGPFGTQLFCNMGARVIKVEPPDHGDDTRTSGPYVDGQSLYYSLINHGKESVVLDLKNDRDKSVFINMLKQADVLAENFHPGTMEKLGFSWKTLQGINPRFIYTSSSGFGYTGPLKDAPAHDTVIQIMSGIVTETGYPDAPPVRVGTSLADLCGGIYLFSGMVGALCGREKSQGGAHVDIAMFDATLSFLEHGLMACTAAGESPQRLGNRRPYMAPFDVFNIQDRPIAICCGSDKLFLTLCQALEPTEPVNDPRFSSNISHVQNQAILEQYIERMLETQTTEVWLTRIHEIGISIAPLLSVAEAIKLPQARARNMLIEAGGIMISGSLVKINGCTDPHVMPGVATLDQHGEQIRQEFSSQV